MRRAVEWLLEVDPVAIRFWSIEIHWYALSYVMGVLFVYWHLGKVGKFLPDQREFLESLISWMVIGMVTGGRVLYVLLYNPDFYIQHPVEIIKVWHGGMSFHGGLLGFTIGTIIYCKKNKTKISNILDLCACSSPLGIFLGRIANLINGELYGKVTNSCIGVVFKNSDMLLRHPTQIYEAVLEGLIPLIFMNILLCFTKIKQCPYALTCIFCLWYSITRCVVEIFREPDAQLGPIIGDWVTMGMLLSFPVALSALIVLITVARKYKLRFF